MPSLEIMLLYAVAFAALTYFFVSTCYLLYGRVPYMLWYWYPDEAGHVSLQCAASTYVEKLSMRID